MKKRTKELALLSFLGLFISTGMAEEYRLVWADEFNTNGIPDPGNWTYENGFVRNHEAQWYQPENAWCTNGLLIIEARREQEVNPAYVSDSVDWQNHRKRANYTSACLITKGLHSWKYGRFEMRAKIDTRAGLWPAFWTLGTKGEWPSNGEIDIMEYYQNDLLANIMWGSGTRFSPQHQSIKTPINTFAPEWSDKFHIWRMDWDENSIKLYVDDLLLNEINTDTTQNRGNGPIQNPFTHPHYILLNLAIGGTCGGDPSNTDFPARFEVDYVRVYQKPTNNSTPPAEQ